MSITNRLWCVLKSFELFSSVCWCHPLNSLIPLRFHLSHHFLRDLCQTFHIFLFYFSYQNSQSSFHLRLRLHFRYYFLFSKSFSSYLKHRIGYYVEVYKWTNQYFRFKECSYYSDYTIACLPLSSRVCQERTTAYDRLNLNSPRIAYLNEQERVFVIFFIPYVLVVLFIILIYSFFTIVTYSHSCNQQFPALIYSMFFHQVCVVLIGVPVLWLVRKS